MMLTSEKDAAELGANLTLNAIPRPLSERALARQAVECGDITISSRLPRIIRRCVN
jgi:hypothetical protein